MQQNSRGEEEYLNRLADAVVQAFRTASDRDIELMRQAYEAQATVAFLNNLPKMIRERERAKTRRRGDIQD